MAEDLNRLHVGEILTPLAHQRDVTITCREENIESIKASSQTVEKAEVDLSFPDGTAIPGFIDLHIHGYSGKSVNSGVVDDILDLARGVTQHGVTTIIPTTLSDTHTALLKACRAIADAKVTPHRGARIAGVHLEGPHINTEQSGAQKDEILRDPSIDELTEYISASNQNIRRITLAPELSGAPEYINYANERDIAVSLGHTDASFETAIESFKQGVSAITHLFNRSGGFHHRKPGIVGAGLTSPDICVELIADLIHLHPATIDLTFRAKDYDSILLVTDSIHVTGLPPGEYELKGQSVILENGVCRLKHGGNLAGSTLTMDQAVRNIVGNVGVDLETAIRTASTNPAAAQGLSDRGRLEEGYRADITILDEDQTVIGTIIGGELVYSRGMEDNSPVP